MTILDNRDQIKALDKSNILGSIEQLPQQIEHAWQESSHIDLKSYSIGIQNIVVVGMGGSNLGAKVIKSVYSDQIKLPFEIISNYHLPAYVDNNTLVILSSYSGTTEEVLSAAKEAIDKQAKIAVITSGGDLVKLAQKHNFPLYHIKPLYNPSNQPRMAIGYTITGTLGLFNSIGLLNVDTADISHLVEFLSQENSQLTPELLNNPAKKLAVDSKNDMIIIVSADHLTGAAHVFNNQINENGKHLTSELILPELNHHYLEALSFPPPSHKSHFFIFFDSQLYSKKISHRLKLTKKLVSDRQFPNQLITLKQSTPLNQAFELIQLGAYTNFYLAMLHGIDPAPIPNVDHFKSELKKLT